MGGTRSVEDRLRAEYATLAPVLRRTLMAVQTEVTYLLLAPTLALDPYERMLVRGRIKECESAIDSLRRRQESRGFDQDRPDEYTLTSLPDLVAVRVLAFPRRRLEDADRIVRARIRGWTVDPVPSGKTNSEPIALKYHGYWNENDRVRSEIQIVSLLIGLFWEVEHGALYKPDPDLRGAMQTPAMRSRTNDVLDALSRFEEEFGRTIEKRFEFPGEE